MTSLRKWEWEAIAGLVAAVVAIVLHFLHVTDVNVLRVITLVLVALLFLRDLRNEERSRSLEKGSKLSVQLLEEIRETTRPVQLDLIGPAQLRHATALFAERARGEVVWFNACPKMFESKDLCDLLLRPFLSNPHVTAIRFVLDHRQREHWRDRVDATIAAYLVRGIVVPPTWADLDSGVSFLIAETDTVTGKAERWSAFGASRSWRCITTARFPATSSMSVRIRNSSVVFGRWCGRPEWPEPMWRTAATPSCPSSLTAARRCRSPHARYPRPYRGRQSRPLAGEGEDRR
jgi:hypothetical protein